MGQYLSVITIGEIQNGISRLPQSKKKTELTEWLQNRILTEYRDFILPITVEVMLHWGELTGTSNQRGYTMPIMDSLIAATAATYGLKLVTHNSKDFQHCGIEIINPSESL